MKTAISIPDKIFISAENLASRLGTSRSQLYTQALKSYIDRQDNKVTTDLLNKLYAKDSAGVDPVLKKLQSRSVLKEEW